jgi:hypothetical protein
MAKTVSFDITVPVVLAHPNLLEAKKYKRNGKETGDAKFSASFVFDADHPELENLKKAAIKAAREMWPDRDIPAAFKAGELKFPWTSGDKLIEKRSARLKKDNKEYDGKADYMKGKVVVKASSKFDVALAAVVSGKIIDLDSPELKAKHKGLFYFGVQALGTIAFMAYDAVSGDENAKDGVTAYLQCVLSTGKGERLAGGVSAAERFKGYQGTLSAESPTEGMDDDEIPF